MGRLGYRLKRGFIYVSWQHDRQRFLATTGAKVIPSHWLGEKVSSKDPHHDLKNHRIGEIASLMLRAVSNVRTEGYEPTAHAVRREFNSLTGADPVKKQIVEGTFWERYDDFLKSKIGQVRFETDRNLRQTMSVIKAYEKHDGYEMDPQTFDKVMFSRLIQYLYLVRKFRDSTIRKHTRTLREFYKWAYPLVDRAFMKLKLTEPEKIITLTKEELRRMIDADLSGYMDKTRDLFVFSACTGMRYSDTQRFHPSWVKNDMIHFEMKKISHKAITPLINEANKVLIKYGGTTPSITNQPYNRFLKELGKYLGLDRAVTVTTYSGKNRYEEIFPLWAVLCSHTARKTFISLALEAGVNLQDVMWMSGHNDYRSMKPYIHVRNEHLRSQGNRYEEFIK